jgi:hypothetical protein
MKHESLMDQWKGIGDLGEVEEHTATPLAGDTPSRWTAEWVLRVLCAPHRIRASYHEEEALRHFEQAQREGTR